MMINMDKCPVCDAPKSTAGIEFCERCGWEFRFYLSPLSGEFLNLEQRRLTMARKYWIDVSLTNMASMSSDAELEISAAYSYGILVSYHGEECVSNMIYRNDPVEIVREWPVGKFRTQVDNQSDITLSVYRNQSDEKVVPVSQCEKMMQVVISLDNTALQGTPINIYWERSSDNILLLKATCLNKETVVRIG